jgi:PAS domain S-box-containing protein
MTTRPTEADSREEIGTLATERSRQLFERAPDGIFVTDPEGRVADVNPAGCRILGYARDELVGRSISDSLLPEDLPRQAAAARRLREGATELSEWQLRRKDGSLVHVELAASALPNGELLAFVRDVTERHEADQQLRLSERLFSGVVSISADAIVMVDEAQRVALFNHGAETLFGWTKEEIVGAPLETLLPDRFRALHREHVKRFAEGREAARHMGSRRAPILALRKDGDEVATDATISKLEVGGKTMLVVALRDIEDQARAEDEERVLAEVGQVTVEAGSDYGKLLAAIASVLVRHLGDWCTIDVLIEGRSRRVQVAHADPSRAEACGALARSRSRDERNIASSVMDTRRPLVVREVVPDYLRSLTEAAEHLELLDALDPSSFVIVPLLARGHCLGALGAGTSRPSRRRYGPRDVSALERIASRIALAVDNARLHEELEAAVRARDEVLAIVAHDLRNPLNAIVLQAQTLRRRGDQPERRDQEPVVSIRRAVARMNQLIQDLLEVACLESGQKLSISPRELPVATVLAEAVDRHREAATELGRSLAVDPARESTRDVRADRARLLQVFDNLMGNAIKFSRKRITVGASPKGDDVLFWVTGDGTGVPAEQLPRLFDRFWQSMTADRRGVGLGLWIVKEIVTSHGGRIWVESELGVGTTFYFTLPAAPRPQT